MKASVFVGTSLDGFIARSNGKFDFLPPGRGEPHGYTEFMASIDAVVMGRHTFDTVAAFPQWPYDKPVFTLSTRELPPAPRGARVERLTGHPTEVIATLGARGIQHVNVDGGITIQRFLEVGVI